MKFFIFVIPFLLLFLILYSTAKKVNFYETFTSGAKNSLPVVYSIFPYLVGIFIMTELFSVSGVSSFIINLISPLFSKLGIPKEIVPLIILKPFSGSGSLATLNEIYLSYGVDSYIGNCASVVFGSSETVFYISAVYYTNVKEKRLLRPISISLVATFISTLFACYICRFI